MLENSGAFAPNHKRKKHRNRWRQYHRKRQWESSRPNRPPYQRNQAHDMTLEEIGDFLDSVDLN